MSTGSGHHSYKGRDADEARGRLAWQSEASCVSVLSSLDWCSVFEEQDVLRAISQLTSCLSKPREVCLRTTMPRSMKVTQWATAERLLCAGRASPSPAQLLAFAPGKEQAAGVWEP